MAGTLNRQLYNSILWKKSTSFPGLQSQRLKPRPNDRNMPTKHIATWLGATCCARLAAMLWCVATCWVLLAQVWKCSNLSQQHPTRRNRVAKRTEHVAPNNVAICCVGMLRSFGRGLREALGTRLKKWKKTILRSLDLLAWFDLSLILIVS